ncbi:hypothetical protein Q9233_017756, partial [Columba guinea]
GLVEAVAAERLLRDGPNELRPPRGTPECVKFGRQLAGGLQCLMWVAAAICLIAYGVQEGEGDRGSSDNVGHAWGRFLNQPLRFFIRTLSFCPALLGPPRTPGSLPDAWVPPNRHFYPCLGTATGLVINTGDRTIIGRIASLASGVENEKTPIAIEIEHFVDIIAGLAIFFGATFFVVAMVIGYPFLRAMVFFMAIVVAYVPEGLLATVTVCLSLTAKRLARKNCVVKNLEAVETLGSTSVICSDKTGTLTQNRMTVAHLWFDNQIHAADTTEDQSGQSFDQSSDTWAMLSRVVTLCNRAQFKPGQENVPVAKVGTSGTLGVPIDPNDLNVSNDPNVPIDPIVPINPIDPNVPNDPIVPVDFNDPIDLNDPNVHIDAVDPNDPIVPISPISPIVPIVPIAPIVPISPIVPITPNVNIAPNAPIAPIVPIIPNVPIAPITRINIPELTPYLIYITASVPLPLGCITILFIELCTDI